MKRLSFLLLLASTTACDPEFAPYVLQGSIEQVAVTHAKPGEMLTLVDGDDHVVQTGTADALGSFLFRKVTPGRSYHLSLSGPFVSHGVDVVGVAESLPEQDFYDKQLLQPGYNYLTTRDGTTLSAYVFLPGPIDKGPYPTVIDYSGYSPSKPGAPIGNYAFLCDTLPVLCDAPNDPSALIAGLLGYASVSVNIRGTGCSGGAYDYFETLQKLDGYDVIETVAAQPWALHHKVGMVGLSYPGITQLFVAAERPPGLAAIAPLSVIGNTWSTLLPGGMLNDGFALSWVTNVLSKADPYAQGWEQGRVDGGDAVCKENQLLHGQKIDNVAQARLLAAYVPSEHDGYNPATFVDRIAVPVFLAGAYQDEQTGPTWHSILDRFTSSPSVRFTIYNGVHPDGFAPQVLSEWAAFLDLFVAQRLPHIDPAVRTVGPLLFDNIFHAQLELPMTAYEAAGTYEAALALWKSDPPLRAIFESGGQAAHLGEPIGTFERRYASWPPKETKATRWYFQPDGTLGATTPPPVESASTFALDPAAGERGVLAPGGNVWDKLPKYAWPEPLAGSAVIFESPPLDADVVMLGTGSADLWIRSPVDDADLEINLTELRPDGQEMYVQSGWLRASYRALGPSSTELGPVQTYFLADIAPLVADTWTEARVPIAPFGHAFRKGSKIRISVDTPGDSRAEWRFSLKTFTQSDVRYAIGHGTHASSVVLPVIEGATVPTPLPACPSLRGQPCRAAMPYVNVPAP